MLLYAVRVLYDKRRVRWVGILVILLSAAVVAFEIWMLTQYKDSGKPTSSLQNYIILLFGAVSMIILAVVLLTDRGNKKAESLSVMYIFSFVCINFGIIISANSYRTGGQILTFLTMELFVICLLVWRPWLGFLVLTVSYLMFYYKISSMLDLNTVGAFTGVVDFSQYKPGLGDGIKINGFTMWLSTLLFCISNYNKTLSQALKDEHLEDVNAYLSKISVEDELTGIHNMVYFRSEAKKLLGYVTTDKSNIVFLFFDIENFKYYNEKNGFQAGNELLIEVGELLESTFEGSLVSRFSDDHFVVLTKFDGCREKVDEVYNILSSYDGEIHIELKCGAYRPHDQEDVDPSLACDYARFACNSTKKRFDQYYRMYDSKLEEKFRLKQYIINNVDTAIESGWIKVYYQPVVETKGETIIGFEALARWLDPTYGLLPPSAFIEVLEEHRQIHKIDICIIEEVCKTYRAAADNGWPFAPVSLNFSRLDFELCNIVDELWRLAKKYNVPREYLDVEITESALSDNQDLLKAAMRSLKELGYKVWLDDFGSGYSSLNVLKDYQFDVLKIDMKFLSGFSNNQKTRPILKNIVSLTKQLGMVSLTEGVEEREQFDFLSSIDCDRAQGYLFSKPQPFDELRRHIENGELRVSELYMQGTPKTKA
ncbi:MAG: bifunctional diguanylate cyclase/phosphodiesterase [Ruminococcus sp.]|nr:bifunctional diguanylate cyclase/phosphodiesterase [Ruminococcus sp.]